MAKKTIIIQESDDGKCKAVLAWNPEVCGYGPSPDAAVGSLIQTHPEEFGIEIEIGK